MAKTELVEKSITPISFAEWYSSQPANNISKVRDTIIAELHINQTQFYDKKNGRTKFTPLEQSLLKKLFNKYFTFPL